MMSDQGDFQSMEEQPLVGAEWPGTGRSDSRTSLESVSTSIAAALSARYRTSVWLSVDVDSFKPTKRHTYLELSDVAIDGHRFRAEGVIRQVTRDRVLGDFEQHSGVGLCKGMRVNVLARPRFDGRRLLLVISAIESAFSSTSIARNREAILKDLSDADLRYANFDLEQPEFRQMLVIVPAGGAAYGDIQKESDLLTMRGDCDFHFRFAPFEGPDAGHHIARVLRADIGTTAQDSRYDAVLIARGGGAAADLAWLDCIHLARAVCACPVPVLVGLGHEHDETVLDKVAWISLGTPSKLIYEIARAIRDRRRRDASKAAEG